MRSLRILHISDLHERAPFASMPASRAKTLKWDARQRGQVLGPRFLEALQAVSVGGIDLVCFTGDLADWGQPAEYDKATERIDRILRAVGVPRGRFYAIPGNHDVQRTLEVEAWRGIRRWLEETHDVARLGRWILGVNAPPPGTKPEWVDGVLARTGQFWSWLESYRGPLLSGPRSDPLGYRETIPASTFEQIDIPVHIVGLDSAWLCGADESHEGTILKDQGSIVVTEEQVEAHIRRGEEGLDGLRVGLVHHPLDHLADHAAVRRLLGDDGVDILLHGHQHTPLSLLASEPGAPLRILAAGCLIEGELGTGWPNGFQVVELDLTSRSGQVHFRKWSKSGRFWALGSDIYREAPHGVLTWRDQADGNVAFSAPPAPNPAPPTAPPIAASVQFVTLRIESVRLVDMTSITDALQRFKRRWPETVIDWPPSLTELLEGLKQGLQGSVQGEGADDFAASVPLALQKAAVNRKRIANQIPALVERARDLSDDQLALILHNFMLVSLYRAHKDLAFYSSWEGLKPWQTPKEWIDLRLDSDRRTFANMMGEALKGGKLSNGRLRTAEAMELYDERGAPGLYVLAPKHVLDGPNATDICQWFIPQLEYGWRADDLPPAYQLREWYVDKIIE